MANRAILKHIQTLDFKEVKNVHLFLPISAKKEIDTYLITDWLRANHPKIKLVLSRSDFKTHQLNHIVWGKNTHLAKNTWGITEPQHGEIIQAAQLDLILIPLLAFDETGHRVGYGKGFYDRFLAECGTDTQKIGLSHFEPIPEIEDTDDLDIRLNACISPQKIWRF